MFKHPLRLEYLFRANDLCTKVFGVSLESRLYIVAPHWECYQCVSEGMIQSKEVQRERESDSM